MPTYEYACTSCGQHIEAVQSFSDAPLTTCPHCGGTLRKVFAPVGIVLKGSGFYKTDSRAAGNGSKAAGSKSRSEGGSSSGDGAAKTDGGAKEGTGSSGGDKASSGSGSANGSGSSSGSSGSSGSTTPAKAASS